MMGRRCFPPRQQSEGRLLFDPNSHQVSRTARRLVSLHGQEAPRIAAEHAARMERLGDPDGRTDWLRIMIRAQSLLLRKYGW